ncbi:hypothetical protein FQN60_012208 [Etheostoma spectabile]|uniref:Uncharacterized protein n=1 Tax=Etheostoma spectabile TaxID=54343 RepID=A0A5J5DPE7_9PERO|nr:hypothetical protein FQN60_018767 [Etheostoma spectabile]KAA8595073.1 hypothetical protein FQN60_012208 [Etheostoma spectabile]
MSQMILIHTHVVDSDYRGLAGDVCNHKPGSNSPDTSHLVALRLIHRISLSPRR